MENRDVTYEPLPDEYLATGIVGIILYSTVLGCAGYSLWMGGVQSKATQIFYACLVIMSILELPRFCQMTSSEAYDSKASYGVHILAGSFFFISFSVVCYQWGLLLEVSSASRIIFGKHGLFVANVIFFIVDLISMSLCITAPSLNSYFKSAGFTSLTIIEGVKNCVYAGMLSFNGLRLVHKLWNYSQEELRRTSVSTEIYRTVCCCFDSCNGSCLDFINRGSSTTTGSDEDTKEIDSIRTSSQDGGVVFLGVVLRITFVLVLTSVCFALRICMIILKILAMHTSAQITAPNFSLFGFAWTVLGDFIPRVVPALAFMQLMRNKRPVQESRKRTNSLLPLFSRRSASLNTNTAVQTNLELNSVITPLEPQPEI